MGCLFLWHVFFGIFCNIFSTAGVVFTVEKRLDSIYMIEISNC